MNKQVTQFQSLTQASYILRPAIDPKARLIILNHGFQSNNERMWSRFVDRLPMDCHVLAANGPFPLPVQKEQAWKVGYSWYFYDNFKDQFLVNYDIPSAFIKNLCDHLGFADNSKTLIGYSQGGYVTPHMAETLSGVDHVIGLACRFKIQNPQWPEGLLIEAIHGEDDEVVQWEGAQESFARIPKKFCGRLVGLPGAQHKPTPEMLDTVAQWVRERIS